MKHTKITLLAMAGAISLSLSACTPTTVKEGWTAKNGYTQWHPQTGPNALSTVGTQCYFCNGDVKVPPPVDGDDDQDGVLNSKDQCPNTPRGVKVDERGCPLDSDKDGVTDDKDKCPNTPMGAKVNMDGCWVLDNLHFKIDKAQIEPISFPLLDNVVMVLKSNPNVKVEIQGHTDNTGSPAHNDKLSKDRAASVKKYLTSKGIAANRLSTNGYGATRPVAPNDTLEGRAKNRRVELHTQG
ncbi:MAG: OmpA family protein [Magnetococcales bacterium]|nr:OmpA family protein [Magnetococcales bacterium]